MSAKAIISSAWSIIAKAAYATAPAFSDPRQTGEAIGVNQTDLGCLDVLGRLGSLTAGQLAAHTGLSSGAMTTAIDRLERSGYVRRQRDPEDRRRVLVELTDAARGIDSFYADHVLESERLYREYTTEQLTLLLGFVRRGRELNERRATKLESRPPKS